MVSQRLVNLVGALGVALSDGQRRAMGEASGLADTEAAAVNVIGLEPGRSIASVRVALAITHPGTVRVVDRLVARGLVERRAGVDGRTVGLHLTAEGEGAFTAQLAAREGWLAPFAEALGPGGEALLDRLLGLTTGTDEDGEHLCRLCDDRVCPQDRCPVTLAVGKDP
ncbi:MAG TPA: MarR family winged helix-turn-helix transcriptional regulator [Iamia sp.]|nr:MarR family winged helix-turn-helix transcriptional regulator [Iamia sp.]